MTYKEIKTRLKKCETILTSIKNGTYKEFKEQDPQEVIKQVNVLKESLTKRLSEMEKGTISTDDEKKAKDLADQGHNVELTEEENSTPFSVEETKAIAKDTGKALAKALKQSGDELSHMKAKNIEEGSFEIYVQYKNGSDDQFSFYITDDTLHLVDFSFDKELVDVGVKPSGEAVVNVDVLAQKFVEHFRSLNEGMTDKIEEGEGDDHHVIKVPNRHRNEARHIIEDYIVGDEKEGRPPYNVTYQENDATAGDNLHTFIFIFEDEFISNGDAYDFMTYTVQALRERFDDVVSTIDDLEENVEDSNSLIKNLKSAAKKYLQEDEDYNPDYDDDYEDYAHPNIGGQPLSSKKNEHHDEAGMEVPADDHDDLDLGHQDDEPHMLKKEVYDIAVYAAKLYKQLKNYDAMDGEVDFPHWWQRKVTLAREYMSKAQHYLEFEEKEPMIDQLALEGKKYKSDAQRKAIYATKAEKGELNEDSQDAIDELQNLLEELYSISSQVKSLMRQYFPTEFNQGESFGAFNFGTSENPHDTTFEKILENLEEEGHNVYEGASGTKHSVASIQKAHSTVVDIMKDLANEYKAGDKSVVDQLKTLTTTKNILEAELEKAVAGTGAGQELDPNISEAQNIPDVSDKSVVHKGKRYVDMEDMEGEIEIEPDMHVKVNGKVYRVTDTEVGDNYLIVPVEEEDLMEGKKTCCGRCGQVHEKKGNCTRKKLTGKARCDV